MPITGNPWVVRLVSVLALLVTARTLWYISAIPPGLRPWPLSILDGGFEHADHDDSNQALSAAEAPGPQPPWFPPRAGLVNNLTAALDTPSGVYGFRYDGSLVPDADYGVYNWCNMPHVRRDRYVVPPPAFALRYVELVHRHHKRTPYAANAFPAEPYRWNCSDARVHHYGLPDSNDHRPGDAFLRPDAVAAGNPFAATAPGLHGSCRFPQLTRGGLVDAWQHGADLYGVYHDLLHFLPDLAANNSTNSSQAAWTSQTAFRVTNNQITSETASMVWGGMLAAAGQPSASWSLPFSAEPVGLDSLEPQYPCPAGADAFAAITSTDIAGFGPDFIYGISGVSRSRAWDAHLAAAADVFRRLDDASGVRPDDRDFHSSFDHYYDSLSARRCHDLPDIVGVDRSLADTVFRLGQWEYSRMFRDDVRSLGASVALWGVWVAQLAAHLRTAAVDHQTAPCYRHNVAHDGSLSRLLSILQADDMVWPGMGSEVVVELWEKTDNTDDRDAGGADVSTHPNHYVRILFGGRVLRSSHPDLADLDMRPLDVLLAYIDGLVGPDAGLVPDKCKGALPLWPRSAAPVTCLM